MCAPNLAAGACCALDPALRELEVTAITADSRAAGPGVIFAALPGRRIDGRRFIADAVARGAAAVLAPSGTEWPAGVERRPLIEDTEPRRLLARIAATLAGPAPRTLAAVTGTNGKTSTVDFLRQIWRGAGLAAASIGTLGVIAESEQGGGGLTSPDPVSLANTLARLARAGIAHAALEASSHGLDQFRLDGCSFAAAAFTNLTRDHLDYHGSMAAYRAAKLRLFETLLRDSGTMVTSSALDAETEAALAAIAGRRHLPRLVVGEAAGADWRLLAARPLPEGQELAIAADGTTHRLLLPVAGRFQADNALVAAALASVLGTDPWPHVAHLVPVRGRMERAAVLANGAAAYVDYAHTPDALERLIAALRPHTPGRLVLVFGAGGDRDPGKRPLMGRAACAADVVIVTDDNPRSEDPGVIRAAILAACPGAIEIGDRAHAIAEGLAMLRAGDVLAVAGKGHEQGQVVGATVLPFDDASVIRALAGGTA
ncbi:MAG: UDP-N-acetylmuramoyl-L-alanyl-D-glutamate--2,6-diaminopimelate ligase [Rhodospirillales bacterium]|nr:UDP-N-acetylmuramoyl-L-alanyl-D-glutamate--2,6-diaminopimelate ligase [Rhodospirillales bacterium]